MKKKALEIKTVHQCNCCLGCQTLHPLASVIDLSKANLEQQYMKLGFYSILLIEGEVENTLYGRKYYDYSNASLLFLTPGESLKINESERLSLNGQLLIFHPDLLYRTSLGGNIGNYTFFCYALNEALHLSLREKTKAMECIANIREELQHSIDCHSKTLISRHIELLLDYCSRFHERQFITRNEANKEIVNRTNLLLDKYMQSEELRRKILPSAEYCADKLSLSPCYFNDLLKFETGKTFSEYFQLKRLEVAKRMLSGKNLNISQIAEILGFPSVQYFSNLFTRITGVSPNEYRLMKTIMPS